MVLDREPGMSSSQGPDSKKTGGHGNAPIRFVGEIAID